MTRATLRKNNFMRKLMKNMNIKHGRCCLNYSLTPNNFYIIIFVSCLKVSVCEHYSFLCTQLDDFEQRFLHTFVHMFSLRVELTSAKYEVVVTAWVHRMSTEHLQTLKCIRIQTCCLDLDRFKGSKVTGLRNMRTITKFSSKLKISHISCPIKLSSVASISCYVSHHFQSVLAPGAPLSPPVYCIGQRGRC